VLEDQKQVIKEINLSFLKDWKTYQCREDPNKFIEVWTMDKNSSLKELDEAFMAHPLGEKVAPRFMALIGKDSYRNLHYDKIIST